MKKILLALLTTVLLATPLVAISESASAASGTPGCVTRAEYQKAKRGMAESKVHKLWGTTGRRMSHASSGGYHNEIRTYKVCNSRYSTIAASYSKSPRSAYRLDAKTAVWVG